MNQNEKKGKRLWKNIKTEKYNKQSDELDSSLNPRPSSIPEQLKQEFQIPNTGPIGWKENIASQKELHNLIQQSNTQQQYFHEEFTGTNSANNQAKNCKQAEIQQSKNIFGAQDLQNNRHEDSIVEQVVDIKNFDFGEQQMMIQMANNNQNQNYAIKKLQDISKNVQNLSKIQKRLGQQFFSQIGKAEKQIRQKYLQQIQQIIKFYAHKASAKSKDDRIQSNDSNKQMVEILKRELKLKQSEINRLEQKNYELNTMNTQLQIKLEKLEEQNSSFQEVLFDCEQKIAQVDLEIQDKVKDILSKKQNITLPSIIKQSQNNIDKEFYLRQIKQLEAEVEILGEKCLGHSQSEANLQIFKQFQQKLREKQQIIKAQEAELEHQYSELQIKKNQLEDFYDQLKAKQTELRIQQATIKNKLSELSVRQAKMMEANAQNYPQSRGKRNRNQYDEYDYRSYGVRDQAQYNHHITPKIKNYGYQRRRNPVELNTSQNRSIKEYEVSSQRSHSRSRERYVTNPTKTIGRVPQRLAISGASGSGVDNGRANSHVQNNKSNKLHNLGSKLERLRQEIRKQIHEAR